jgi:integrase
MAYTVLEHCPDAEWRLIFALCRFGGLRSPSELLCLEWPDVLWDRDRIRVHSPKKEGDEHGGDRFIPIFPELRPYLKKPGNRPRRGPGTSLPAPGIRR